MRKMLSTVPSTARVAAIFTPNLLGWKPGPPLPAPRLGRPALESCLSPAASGGGAREQPTSRRSAAPISSPYEMKFHRGIRKEMRPGRSVLLGPPPFLSRGHGF